MSKHLLYLVLMGLFLISCTAESIDSEDENQPESSNPDNSNAICTGEIEISGNRNHRLMDPDYRNSKHIGRDGEDDISKKFLYNNGTFICTGTFNEVDFNDNGNLALYAVNEAFETIWTFPEEVGEFYDVVHTSDDNYIAVGRKGNADSSVIYVVKVNLAGELIWDYTVEVDDETNLGAYATSVIERLEGGYIIAGKTPNSSNVFGFGDSSFAFLLSEDRQMIWSSPLSTKDFPSEVIINNDDNYVFTFKQSQDVVVNELDTNGNLLKQNSFGSSDLDGALNILLLKDNSYLVTGYTLGSNGDVKENYGNTDIWVLKLDNNLNLIKGQTFGGFGYQIGLFAVELEDGTIFLTAQSSGNFIVERYRQGAIFLRITQDLCLIDWNNSALKSDDYSLSDVIWDEDKNEIITFSYENDRSNIYDTTDDFYHELLRHKLVE